MKSKNSQSEVLTTMLLVMVGIIAVTIVSTFVINLVRNNLKGTDCLEAADQIKINSGVSFYNSTSKLLYLSIGRQTKSFVLTGIGVSYGDNSISKTLDIMNGSMDPNIGYKDITGLWIFGSGTSNLKMPSPGETRIYAINLTSPSPYELSNIEKVGITPILEKVGKCDRQVDEEEILSRE